MLQHFECYKDIKEISSLRDQVCQIRSALGAQILSDFKESFGGKGGLPVRTLADACAVVDALEPKVKKELLHWFINMQLQVCRHCNLASAASCRQTDDLPSSPTSQEYVLLFSPGEESAWLSHVERRYAWLKKHLLAFEEARAQLFPPHWRLSERITEHFCQVQGSFGRCTLVGLLDLLAGIEIPKTLFRY